MSEENTTAENTEATEKTEAPSSLKLSSFYGQKAGMTRIFDEQGNHIPVTVIKLVPNVVSQVKTKEKDGYEAYQVAYYQKREKLINKPTQGHLKKAGLDGKFCRFAEVKTDSVDAGMLGKELSVEEFGPKTYVDVTGTTKGKGFAGVIKRYGFAGGPASHGSKFHRTTGSIGNRATPGRVWRGRKLPGHMGDKRQTVQNLVVVETNLEKGYMLIKGSVPGSKDSFVRISKSVKK